MAHKITMHQPSEHLLSSDVVFIVRKDRTKIGELHISKGNIVWWPKNSKMRKYRVKWSDIPKLFEDESFRVKN